MVQKQPTKVGSHSLLTTAIRKHPPLPLYGDPPICVCVDAAGILVRNFALDGASKQQLLQEGPYELAHLSILAADVVWPTWQQQVLRLRLSGLRIELAQRSMAQVGGQGLPDAASVGGQAAVVKSAASEVLWPAAWRVNPCAGA